MATSTTNTRTPRGKLLKTSNSLVPKDARPNLNIPRAQRVCLKNAKRLMELRLLSEERAF